MPTKPKPKPSLYNIQAKASSQWSANSDKFYHSSKWRKLRLLLFKINPICLHCQTNNKTTIATVADHIKPVRLGGETWDLNNLQPLCESCHNIKSAKERYL